MLTLLISSLVATNQPTVDTSFLQAYNSCGTATYYDEGYQTANGEPFYPDGITAAHLSLPFGSWVRVTRQDTGEAVEVRINDRGPYSGAIIDLSRGAFTTIGDTYEGVIPVCITVISGIN